jgi:hypothetical protein
MARTRQFRKYPKNNLQENGFNPLKPMAGEEAD